MVPGFSTGISGNNTAINIATFDSGISRLASGVLAIGTGAAESASGTLIAGNVGIGSSAPLNTLDIGTGGGIHMASGVPTSTTNALYSNGSTLMWNGSAVGGGSSFSSDVSMTGSGTGLAITNNETVGGTLGITGLTTLTGGATSAGAISITNTTAAASYGSGALTVSGGARYRWFHPFRWKYFGCKLYLRWKRFLSALPSYSFTSDTSTGAYLPVVGSYAISAGGSERMRITRYTGNVGIGTTSPVYPLDIE